MSSLPSNEEVIAHDVRMLFSPATKSLHNCPEQRTASHVAQDTKDDIFFGGVIDARWHQEERKHADDSPGEDVSASESSHWTSVRLGV
jgi:hypothetical protein